MFFKLESEINDRTKSGQGKDLLRKPCVGTQTPGEGSTRGMGLPHCLCPQTLATRIGIWGGGVFHGVEIFTPQRQT